LPDSLLHLTFIFRSLAKKSIVFLFNLQTITILKTNSF